MPSRPVGPAIKLWRIDAGQARVVKEPRLEARRAMFLSHASLVIHTLPLHHDIIIYLTT